MANSAHADTLPPGGHAADDEGELALKDLAARYGLSVSGARPGLVPYTRQLWQRRHFIVAFANAKTRAAYATAQLGQLWQILTPLFNAAIYYLVFGLMLKSDKGVHNYIAFLVTGIFIFTFTQSAVLAGTRSISDQLPLIRALHFPRACLPISFTVVQLQQLLISMLVLCGIVLGTGEPVTLKWLLIIPALALQFVFNTGLSMIVARIGAQVTDMKQLMPFLLRTWLYVSGVFYSISVFTRKAPEAVRWMLEANPAAVYIELARDALVESHHKIPMHTWALGVGWALVIGIGGYVWFWQAEEKYGRG
ncbi:ABC transporter permease [Yinghuangia seranimata]|uniref:ABC transporter permease n=1 Tax=Yinghuangia seranimata TaxID=408067 RepID=UPI00248B6247|nr:ABC transporter permease [Yinghuangia seranimata]MDI2131721.1 ABC transporter permease [Yinghuangia seranimata]